jgi:plastocyanin
MTPRTAVALLLAFTLGAVSSARARVPEAVPASPPAPVAGAPTPGAAAPAVEKPKPPPTYSLSGRLVLTEKSVPTGDATIDLRDGAVWFEPDAGATPPRPQAAQMVTVRKQFSPQLLVVPVGSTVAFPNQDPILHNVFSVSGKNRFDLGLVGSGKGKSVVFRDAGLVRVFCNVHHAMFAHVLVVSTPFFARLDKSGGFRLEGIPGGSGQLFFWHSRGEPGARRVQLPFAAELKLELPITVAKIPTHKNKLGQSYTRGSYD